MARLRYLTREYVEYVAHRLAAKLFTDYGDPLPAFELFGGLRDGGALLESALGLPQQPYYRTLYDKAGALLRSLIKNHPLVDGNKRVGVTSTIVFLAINGRALLATNDELVKFALAIASSEPDMDWKVVANWIRERAIRFDMDEEELASRLKSYPPDLRKQFATTIRRAGVAFDEVAVELRELAEGAG